MSEHEHKSEVERLEELWGGEFGDAYVERNAIAAEGRFPFWQEVVRELKPNRILEVGCNVGANLRWLSQLLPAHQVFGIDVNQKAVSLVRQTLPGVNVLWGAARELPFRDNWFDLVFTTGVLIHQPEESLTTVMSEIVRCSRHCILCGEYFSSEPSEVLYRGQSGALFKRDFGGLYQQLFPQLHLLKSGFLPREQDGWDDVTFWIFEKS